MKKKIEEEMKWRESMIKLASKQGISKAARKYRVNRSTVYKWLKRYDGKIENLRSKSTRPHHHPNEHTEEEIKLIKDMWKRNNDCGLVVFWIKLRQRGYKRSISGLYHQMRKLGIYNFKKKKRHKKLKEYIQMEYPGQRVQVDIKYVPLECITTENLKLYQHTAIDEYSRLRYLQIYSEASTYTTYQFVRELIKRFPFKIEEIRTDNGIQFTNRLLSKQEKKTLFEEYLESAGIKHDVIRPYTPKHNGKVERSHRKDSERFYKKRKFYSLEDARQQIKGYLKEYNNFPHGALSYKTPTQIYNEFVENAIKI